jgi:chorismate--pyruvate lyase
MALFEARWMPESELATRLDDRRIRGWLVDKGSLTQRLIDHCGDGFRVRLRRQGWLRPRLSEARLLDQPSGRLAMIREVDLLCHGVPVVFARTVIPAASLLGRSRSLAGLGNSPLGAMLFRDPTTRRERVQYARIGPRQALFATATRYLEQPVKELQARRTLFCFHGKPLLVNEIFLPTLFEQREAAA